MNFLDDSQFTENQEKLVIQVTPYGPQWFRGFNQHALDQMARQGYSNARFEVNSEEGLGLVRGVLHGRAY